MLDAIRVLLGQLFFYFLYQLVLFIRVIRNYQFFALLHILNSILGLIGEVLEPLLKLLFLIIKLRSGFFQFPLNLLFTGFKIFELFFILLSRCLHSGSLKALKRILLSIL